MNTAQFSPLVRLKTTSNTQNAVNKTLCWKLHICQFLKPILKIHFQSHFVSWKIKWPNLQSSKMLLWKMPSYPLELMTSFLSSQFTPQKDKFQLMNWQGMPKNWKTMEFAQPIGSKAHSITIKWWTSTSRKAPMSEANSTWESTTRFPTSSVNKAKILSSWPRWHLLIGKLWEAHTIGTPRPELYSMTFNIIQNTQRSHAQIKNLL